MSLSQSANPNPILGPHNITTWLPDGQTLYVTVREYPEEGKYLLSNAIIQNGLLNKKNVRVSVMDHRRYDDFSMMFVSPTDGEDQTPFTIYTNRDIITYQPLLETDTAWMENPEDKT